MTELSLSGMRVVITGAGPGAERLCELLRNRGADARLLPTIAVVPPDDPAPLEEALRRLSQFDWVVFTSRNAVTSVWERLTSMALPFPHSVAVAAVGPSTATALGERGIRVRHVARQGTSSSLAEDMAGMGLASSRILFPAGNLVRSDLRTRLEAAGARVEQVTAYSVVPPGDTDVAILDTLRTGLVDVVTFSSPSAFHNLVTLLGESDALRKVGLACIGPTTAEAVRAGGLEPVCVAPTPTPDAFAGAISAAWRATRGVARESERESRA